MLVLIFYIKLRLFSKFIFLHIQKPNFHIPDIFWLKFCHDILLVGEWPHWPLNDLLRSLNNQKRMTPKFHSKFSQEFKNQVFRYLDQKNSKFFLVLRPKNQFLNSMFVKVILTCFNYLKMPQYINAAESLNEKHKKGI